ncbi:MAG TPA: hypothetical protein VHR66_27370 [Gemmataceae bacterium]|jgi:predicted Zn-dependent protease|nr:hypothetical protein [Gemmataceae bacterium]
MCVRPIAVGLPALVLAIVCAACSNRLKAPPLTNDAVFHDDAIGLRFLVPSGWAMQSREVVPVGPLPRTIIVVSYAGPAGPNLATLELVAADVPAEADLERFLSENGPGNDQWTSLPPSKAIIVNGAEAIRFAQSRMQGKNEIRREVTAFRRGARVYFFVLAFPSADADVGDAARKTVESVTWTKSSGS